MGDSDQLDLEAAIEEAEEAELEKERDAVLTAVSASRLDTLQKRVAWILNHYPDARDSDVALYIRYWREFEGEHVEGEYVKLKNIYRLTRPASLTRARAKLQNEYRLFLASDEVRKHRGTLSEEEKEKAVSQRPTFPMYTAYADESGKTDNFLVVGAVWFLHGPEIIEVNREVERLAEARGISAELHFKEIDYSKLDFYKEVAALVLARSATISFTSISVERRGHKRVDDAIANLYEHLLLRGVEYHDSTKRAPLPRSLSVFKDREEVGRDKLLMANLEESLRQASEARLEGKLYVDRLAAVDSKENIPVQLGDLYTSSVARVLNATGKRNSARDEFADFFLGELGIPEGPVAEEQVGDMVAHVAL